MKEYVIPEQLLKWVLVYLGKQPFVDVHEAIQMLSQLKEAKSVTKQD